MRGTGSHATAHDSAAEARLVALLRRRLPDIKIVARARDAQQAAALGDVPA